MNPKRMAQNGEHWQEAVVDPGTWVGLGSVQSLDHGDLAEA